MRVDAAIDGITRSLRRLVADAAQKESVRASGAALLSRLERGVSIAIIGPAGVGKSTLCSTLRGASEACGTKCGATIVYQEKVLFGAVMDNRSSTQFYAGAECVFQLTDFSPTADLAACQAEIAAVLNEADIVLWCTDDFGQAEASVWSRVPDHLKDHSFLILPRADLHAQNGTLANRLNTLGIVAAEEFHSLYPVACEQILTRLKSGENITAQHISASGMGAMSAALLRIVMLGRHADIDSAKVLLERYDETVTQASGSETDSSGSSVSVRAQVRTAVDRHIGRLISLDTAAPGNVIDEVMVVSSELSGELSDIVSEFDATGDPDNAWKDEMLSVSDKLMLTGLEEDARSAADAATILLQLTRELCSTANN